MRHLVQGPAVGCDNGSRRSIGCVAQARKLLKRLRLAVSADTAAVSPRSLSYFDPAVTEHCDITRERLERA